MCTKTVEIAKVPGQNHAHFADCKHILVTSGSDRSAFPMPSKDSPATHSVHRVEMRHLFVLPLNSCLCVPPRGYQPLLSCSHQSLSCALSRLRSHECLCARSITMIAGWKSGDISQTLFPHCLDGLEPISGGKLLSRGTFRTSWLVLLSWATRCLPLQ